MLSVRAFRIEMAATLSLLDVSGDGTVTLEMTGS